MSNTFLLQVMPRSTLPPGSTARFVLALCATIVVLLLMVVPAPAEALCENRCQMGTPELATLRDLWYRSYKRVGEHRKKVSSTIKYMTELFPWPTHWYVWLNFFHDLLISMFEWTFSMTYSFLYLTELFTMTYSLLYLIEIFPWPIHCLVWLNLFLDLFIALLFELFPWPIHCFVYLNHFFDLFFACFVCFSSESHKVSWLSAKIYSTLLFIDLYIALFTCLIFLPLLLSTSWQCVYS